MTYQGTLLSSRDTPQGKKARAPHKHMIRRRIHGNSSGSGRYIPASLRLAAGMRATTADLTSIGRATKLEGGGLAVCIPLVSDSNAVSCKLEILMLRYGPPGKALGDIDNRLKALFDAGKKPGSKDEFGGVLPRRAKTRSSCFLDGASV